jgi:hypothetical protein
LKPNNTLNSAKECKSRRYSKAITPMMTMTKQFTPRIFFFLFPLHSLSIPNFLKRLDPNFSTYLAIDNFCTHRPLCNGSVSALQQIANSKEKCALSIDAYIFTHNRFLCYPDQVSYRPSLRKSPVGDGPTSQVRLEFP